MSDGPSDCRAEGELYRGVWRAVYDVRKAVLGETVRERFPHDVVGRVNELVADLGWRFQLARYAEPRPGDPSDPVKLWDAVARLREALVELNIGHRGWSPVIDPEVDYALAGTGYELVQFKKVEWW